MQSTQVSFSHRFHAVFGVASMMLLLLGQTTLAINEVVSQNDGDLSPNKNQHLRGGGMSDQNFIPQRMVEEEQCEDLALAIIGNSLTLVERLSDPEILTIMCFPEERERLLSDIEAASRSTDPCIQKMYEEVEQNHIEAITALESEEGCYEEINRELEYTHQIEDVLSRRGLALKDASNNRELLGFLALLAGAARVALFGMKVANVTSKASGGRGIFGGGGKRRQLHEREGVEETLDLIKDEPFVVPSDINEQCKLIDYEMAVIMTAGPHFVLGAKPVEATDECPSLAFDSNGFYETKTMFVMGRGSGWSAFSDDLMFTLGKAKLENVFDAFDAAKPLQLNEFNVEENNCVHFAQVMWRHLDLPENEGLLNFVVENLVMDENVGTMLTTVGSSDESRKVAGSDKEVLKEYIYKIASRQLDLSEL